MTADTPRRSIGVTLSAALLLLIALIGGGFGLLLTGAAFFAPQLQNLSAIGWIRFFFSVTFGLFLFAGWIGIGLLRLKAWARMWLLFFSVVLVCMGAAIAGLMVLALLLGGGELTVAQAALVIGAEALPMIALGWGWLVFFRKGSVRAQFEGAPSNFTQEGSGS